MAGRYAHAASWLARLTVIAALGSAWLAMADYSAWAILGLMGGTVLLELSAVVLSRWPGRPPERRIIAYRQVDPHVYLVLIESRGCRTWRRVLVLPESL